MHRHQTRMRHTLASSSGLRWQLGSRMLLAGVAAGCRSEQLRHAARAAPPCRADSAQGRCRSLKGFIISYIVLKPSAVRACQRGLRSRCRSKASSADAGRPFGSPRRSTGLFCCKETATTAAGPETSALGPSPSLPWQALLVAFPAPAARKAPRTRPSRPSASLRARQGGKPRKWTAAAACAA